MACKDCPPMKIIRGKIMPITKQDVEKRMRANKLRAEIDKHALDIENAKNERAKKKEELAALVGVRKRKR
jgi:hypothetical protein